MWQEKTYNVKGQQIERIASENQMNMILQGTIAQRIFATVLMIGLHIVHQRWLAYKKKNFYRAIRIQKNYKLLEHD